MMRASSLKQMFRRNTNCCHTWLIWVGQLSAVGHCNRLTCNIISCYNKRLISSNRHAHIALLQNVCLLAAHVQALGGDPLQWGAANFRSSTPPWDYFLPSNTPRVRLTPGGGGGGISSVTEHLVAIWLPIEGVVAFVSDQDSRAYVQYGCSGGHLQKFIPV